jgi:hypothetical protein
MDGEGRLPDPALASGGRASRAPGSELRAFSEPTRAEGVPRLRKLAREANRNSREARSLQCMHGDACADAGSACMATDGVRFPRALAFLSIVGYTA